MAHLQLRGISKSFPGVKALSDVDLQILPGEIHALCGENGAGKSTLMNILSGNLQPDNGEIILDGEVITIPYQKRAFDLGIATVHQHLSLVDSLSVAENIFANEQPVDRWGFIDYRKLNQQTSVLLTSLLMDNVRPEGQVSRLSPAQKQMVEIAKALSKDPSILILDEPTASLTEKETASLFRILNTLKERGVSIIYISHRLDEIYLLADRISVLKDGKTQGTFLTADLPEEALIKLMVGREIKALKTESYVQNEVLLSVRYLTGEGFRNISFQLHRGEILGLSGLVGSGRTEIARAIFGSDKIVSGEVLLRGDRLEVDHPSDAISRGIAYVPEERKALGIFARMSIQDNIISARLDRSLTGLLYDPAKAHQYARDLKDKLDISAPGVEQKVVYLSGGNQQKVVLAKWLLTEPDVLIVDEPTHGIDVGAKFEIYKILKALAAEGKGIIMISSDLPEVLGLCDRIIVIKRGEVAGEYLREDATEEKIMLMAAN